MSDWIVLGDQLSEMWASALWRGVYQGSIAIIAILAATRFLPRLASPAQNTLWRLAHVKLLLSLFWATPVVLPLLPAPIKPTPAPPATTQREVTGVKLGSPAAIDDLPQPTEASSGTGREAEGGAEPPLPLPSVNSWLLLLWLAGLAVYVAYAVRGIREGAQLRAGCAPVLEPHVLELCQELCEELGIRRTPQLLASPREGTPLLMGLRRPAIILPPQVIHHCDERELKLVLAHELAHLRRGDLVWTWLLLGLRGVFYFHPLVWLACREWRETQEAACDHLALHTTGVTTTEYGTVLLRVAELCRPYPVRALPVLGIAESFRTLQRRMIAMRYTRNTTRRWAVAGALLLALAGTSLIPWQLGSRPAVAAPESAASDDGEVLFDFERARDGWFSRDPRASVTVVRQDELVKHGKGALQWAYDPNGDASLVRFQPPLPREAQTLDFWMRCDANGAFQLWFTEADGSVYHTHLRTPANRWQHFQIPLSDLVLGEREDQNGHLDLDQVTDITLQDLSVHHPGGVRLFNRKVWLDGFDLTNDDAPSRRHPVPGEGGRKLLFDDFDLPFVTWATNTEARVDLEREDGRSVLRARYRQGAQSSSAFRITNHWDPRYADARAVEVVARASQPTQLAVTLREFDGTFTGPEYQAIVSLPGERKWGSYTIALSDFHPIDEKARRRPTPDPRRVWLMLVADATDPGKRGEAELQIDRIAAVLPGGR